MHNRRNQIKGFVAVVTWHVILVIATEFTYVPKELQQGGFTRESSLMLRWSSGQDT